MFMASSCFPVQINHLIDSGIILHKSAIITIKLGKVAKSKSIFQDVKCIANTGAKIDDNEYENITVHNGMIRDFSSQYSNTKMSKNISVNIVAKIIIQCETSFC